MKAFVLSGGGNLGALEAGAVEVLMEAGITPDLLVGTSVGALNAAVLATDPTPSGVMRLQAIWRYTTRDHIYPGGAAHAAWHMLFHHDSLYSNTALRAFLGSMLLPDRRTFGDMTLPLYMAATDLQSGELYVFGDDPGEDLLDGLMASAAIPPFFPPWRYRGRVLVDGALAANLPVSVAVAKGATEIYALEISHGREPLKADLNAWEILVHSTLALIRPQWDRDVALCAAHPDVKLHHIVLEPGQPLAYDDFTHTRQLIARGRAVTEAYLAGGQACAPLLLDARRRLFDREEIERDDKVA